MCRGSENQDTFKKKGMELAINRQLIVGFGFDRS
jgi:hypothetical protein